jgi:aspartyl-tRNA(Asn)/glutamyl-tRNA(Gln) amidotransferase subunit C
LIKTMSLTTDDVRGIALLARLDLKAEEEERFRSQLSAVVGHFDRLQSYETAEVDPASMAACVEADDVEAPGLSRDLFLANAPQLEGSLLWVPRVKTSPSGGQK